MPIPTELEPRRLRRSCDPAELGFESTSELEPLEEILGQPRVVEALEFGVEMATEGYNVFALGPPGTAKHRLVEATLAARAVRETTPPDVCYVNNFEDPRRPSLLLLPPGRGLELRADMTRLIDELGPALRSTFEGEEYQNRRQLLEQEFKDRQNEAISELGATAKEEGLALLRTPMGVMFAPLGQEDVISAEEFEKLAADERAELEQKIDDFQGRLQKVLRQFPRWQREAKRRTRELNREVSRFAVGSLFEELLERYADLETVVTYLSVVAQDVVDNAQRFVSPRESGGEAVIRLQQPQELDDGWLQRYRVNVLVNHGDTEGAPVVFEDNPTHGNLIGRIEHVQQMGTLVTDFNLIKSGSLHAANGGYLLIDSLKLLRQPFAWEGLKRALRSEQIKIESIGQELGLFSTYSIEPEPVKLATTIVLLGPPVVYYLLAAYDPDFPRLFKVPADFSERMDYTPDNVRLYARMIARAVEESGLRPFDAGAVAAVLDHGSRSVSDAEKLSLYVGRLMDFLTEADYWAGKAGAETVAAEHVETAVEARVRRSDRLRERLLEEMLRGTVLVDTEGEVVGQVNGLAVLQLGDFAFGRPGRITARTRLGKGEVVNIEREVELSGPIHSKGVLILAGFLGARYAAERPLSLSASLVFEQSYGGVEGDSASSAELYALLSSISGVAIRQSLAVTGSVNQRGLVQAVGGVNQKVEGFFDLCRARGLSGDQGVLIPAANVKNLMLRPDVVEAVERGEFHVYPVRHIDEGIELLTGVEAGRRDEQGVYPAGTVNAAVEKHLESLAERARDFAAAAEPPVESGPESSGDRQEESEKGAET